MYQEEGIIFKMKTIILTLAVLSFSVNAAEIKHCRYISLQDGVQQANTTQEATVEDLGNSFILEVPELQLKFKSVTIVRDEQSDMGNVEVWSGYDKKRNINYMKATSPKTTGYSLMRDGLQINAICVN
jgi:hypothetical protein